ncbi:MAG: HIT domain-containing protein [Caldisphaera sp.]|jgi:Diadenosine tetraphosphate (Ap4A) hydrolase and other HIT family hydrolases|uniref:HIT family protein n=1 Tax=Caldisphaera sp. TaxID=2060322 RepID=UPI00397CD55D
MEWPEQWYRNLWAPWRMSYIKDFSNKKEEEKETNQKCIFCEAQKNDIREALVLFKAKYSFIILNKYPYNSGHLMIAPYKHVSNLTELNDNELLEISKLIKASIIALTKAYKPEGFNVGVNIGEAAGAGVPGHVHIHIVPRWKGDSNYITIIGGVKVVPQSLDDTYNLLKPIIEEVVKEIEL